MSLFVFRYPSSTHWLFGVERRGEVTYESYTTRIWNQVQCKLRSQTYTENQVHQTPYSLSSYPLDSQVIFLCKLHRTFCWLWRKHPSSPVYMTKIRAAHTHTRQTKRTSSLNSSRYRVVVERSNLERGLKKNTQEISVRKHCDSSLT